MGRCGLLLFRVNYHRRLLLHIAVYKETDTKKHKRYAEPLSHIQDHILLETHLRFLDELYKEAHSETSDEEGADEEATVELRQTILVHQYLEYTEKEIAQGFIKLGRMLRLSLAAKLEDKSPWKRCHISVNL